MMALLSPTSFLILIISISNGCLGIYDPDMFIPQNLPLINDDASNSRDNSHLRAKRFFPDRQRSWNMDQILEGILCVFIPPAAVLIHGGHDMLIHMIINIVLWICGWVPGMIHAFWYCFYRD